MSGGELVFIMGNLPNKEYGLSMKDRPRSNVEISTVTNPIIAAPSRAFYDTMTVHMYNNLDVVDIFYTLDGDVPNRNANVYEKRLLINESTVIKAVVSNTDTISSQVETLSFHKLPFRVAIN
jgi:putative alpha-1,2-mannosidase